MPEPPRPGLGRACRVRPWKATRACPYADLMGARIRATSPSKATTISPADRTPAWRFTTMWVNRRRPRLQATQPAHRPMSISPASTGRRWAAASARPSQPSPGVPARVSTGSAPNLAAAAAGCRHEEGQRLHVAKRRQRFDAEAQPALRTQQRSRSPRRRHPAATAEAGLEALRSWRSSAEHAQAGIDQEDAVLRRPHLHRPRARISNCRAAAAGSAGMPASSQVVEGPVRDDAHLGQPAACAAL